MNVHREFQEISTEKALAVVVLFNSDRPTAAATSESIFSMSTSRSVSVYSVSRFSLFLGFSSNLSCFLC